MNEIVETILLFVTLFCLVFIIKRKIFGALIYFVSYGMYFGTDIYNTVLGIINEQVGAVDYVRLFVSFLGVVIPLMTLLDIALNKERKGSTRDKKTDWFYRNKDYDRKLDDRVDKNQYKF